MKKNNIIIIPQAVKQSLLQICGQELQKRKNKDYIDVDVEYIDIKEDKPPIDWQGWLLGFVTSAIVFATLSYSFALAKLVYYFILFP